LELAALKFDRNRLAFLFCHFFGLRRCAIFQTHPDVLCNNDVTN
jgi:hypothetical protein